MYVLIVASKTMDSFLNDMETFRNHLALAREIKSKLEILEQDSHKKEVDDTLDETNKVSVKFS